MSLPSGYKWLKYIQSTGKQYIDTGFKPNQNTRVVMDCEFAKASSGATYIISLAAYEPKAYYQLRIMSSYTYLTSDYGNSTVNLSNISLSTRYLVDKNKNVCTVGDISVTNATNTFQSTSNMWLFGGTTTSGTHQFCTGKIYSCQIYDNGTLIRDFIPCQKPDGTIGLWDDVNSVFYGNAGTGTFTAGPISLNLPVNIGGTWKDANEAFVNISGTWKSVKDAFVNIGGAWKKIG